ncbi:MAG TPA: NADPH-dependent FMN reductase [Candidatus Limnocylindria bacterium]|jgi:chromate reductase|nr:NADPH-dependent FMN reductase [Candidatus Limnocylindria bacterium]
MRFLAISGSLQRRSANTALLRAAARTAPAGVDVVISDLIARVPFFNPDLESPEPPAAVRELRAAIHSADGVLFATPEYAFEMPGVLKNALDWIVGSGELTGKPVAVMSASPSLTGGVRAQLALVQTLAVMSAAVVDAVMIPTIGEKLNADGELVDVATLARVEAALKALVRAADDD